MNIINYFDLYVEKFKWKIVPISYGSKIPINKNWNKNYDLIKNRNYIKNNLCNIGLLLGDVVDVEGDTPEANQMLEALLHGHRCPRYKSAKSTHYLFSSFDPRLTVLRVNGIEFRGRKHHSVLPPSYSIAKYEWVSGPFRPGPAPQPLIDLYNSHKKEWKLPVKPGFVNPVCSLCRQPEFIHKKRHELEVIAFRELNMSWTCHLCRTVDVRELCRKKKNTYN
jgi:hypothetical protein